MDYICTSCNYVGERKRVKPGSTGIEIFLWTMLLIPGPFYTLWRILNKHYACPECGERIMVPEIGKLAKGSSGLQAQEGKETDNILPKEDAFPKNIDSSIVAQKETDNADNQKKDDDQW